jgi:hypothetical protein
MNVHRINRTTRRNFIGAAGAASAGLALGCRSVNSSADRPKTVALIATEVRKHSHAQHFIDRFLEGYGWEGKWHHPTVKLVALYVDQFPAQDLARDRSKRFGVPIYPTVAEALTRGGSSLAVDGVVIIGEHGKYPRNHRNQTLYPRYKWFKEVVQVFKQSGRVVPVFNDKHLSKEWNVCVEMVAYSKRLQFPFLAGSSLPVTWRIPAIDLPSGSPLEESLSICYGGVDSYDFHGLETAQCMSERRRGGESGVKRVLALSGETMWKTLAEREGTRRLFFAALSRSHTVRSPKGLPISRPSIEWAQQASPNATGYFIEHNDGLRTTMLLCNGLLQDFVYAGRMSDGVLSCQMHLPMPLRIATTADFFNPLVHYIERMVLTGEVPYPVERTLLTSGMTLFAVESLFKQQKPIETPGMNISYGVRRSSTFWNS